MKQALVAVVKTTIRDELGYNLYGIRPRYDVETMSPAWEIEDMITGIYISIYLPYLSQMIPCSYRASTCDAVLPSFAT